MKRIKKFNESSSNDQILIKSVEIISDIQPLKIGTKVEFTKPICFIVGDNGVGKSTLLDCIADEFGVKDTTFLKRSKMKSHIKIEKVDTKFPFKFIDFHGDDRKFSG